MSPLLHAAHGHRYCAEHQAFEELGEVEPASCDSAQPDTVTRARATIDGEHSECPLVPARHQHAIAARPPEAPPPLDCQTVGLPPENVEATSPIAVLAVAPKQSPPTA